MPSMHPRPLSCLPHHHSMQKHGMSRRGGIRTPPARAATSRHCSLRQPPSCADSKCPIFLGCGASTTSTTAPLDLLLPLPFNSSAHPPLLQRREPSSRSAPSSRLGPAFFGGVTHALASRNHQQLRNLQLIIATRSKLLIVSSIIQLIGLLSLPPPAKHLPTTHVAVDALATSRRHAGALSKAIATQNRPRNVNN